MSIFDNKAKSIARENGGMLNMFSVFIDLFVDEGFSVDVEKSSSIILRNETDLAVAVIELKLINESSIKILFLMNFLDGTEPKYLKIEDYYNLTQSQKDIYYQLITKVDNEIGKRS